LIPTSNGRYIEIIPRIFSDIHILENNNPQFSTEMPYIVYKLPHTTLRIENINGENLESFPHDSEVHTGRCQNSGGLFFWSTGGSPYRSLLVEFIGKISGSLVILDLGRKLQKKRVDSQSTILLRSLSCI